MGETINLTEEKLRQIIRETISDYFDDCGLLREMSMPRKTFKDKQFTLSSQIIENWCLLRYTTLTLQQKYRVHWRDELKGHLITVSRLHMKQNDTIPARLKVLREVYIDELDYSTNATVVKETCCYKFEKEGIDINSEIAEQVFLDCCHAIEDIIQVIAIGGIDNIKHYVLKI